MKLTTEQLRNIIKQELKEVMRPGDATGRAAFGKTDLDQKEVVKRINDSIEEMANPF